MGRSSKKSHGKYKNYNKISSRRDTEIERSLDEEDKLLDDTSNIALLKSTNSQIESSSTSSTSFEKRSSSSSPPPSNTTSLLSPDLIEAGLTILPQKSKPSKSQNLNVELTPAEIKQAEKESKRLKRKLHQLAERREKKNKREAVSKTLEENMITDEEFRLMKSVRNRGAKETKRERLRWLREKERQG
eukprot:CAMPEP_0118660640 /NCGR_PEP_ID=MMETSP0785-20121206/15806_1 /TAXON_ID=91992 /ORGANISM="Bolidomonas pacifica, Strain CCMP 1866" /LENGTH=187 /DNA_ID=CAMNT_0006553931 /DNA_START=172 /DNA_END=732 /DNA_ORIENTATION=-